MVEAQTEKMRIFSTPRYVQNSFSVIFPRQLDIRRRANDFENKLSGNYGQPQIFPMPDELEPEAPRIIFNSSHSYSQIVISQISITMNVNYSPEWQVNADLRRNYLLERAVM